MNNITILSQKRIQSCYNNESTYGWRFIYTNISDSEKQTKDVWIDNKQEALNQFLNW